MQNMPLGSLNSIRALRVLRWEDSREDWPETCSPRNQVQSYGAGAVSDAERLHGRLENLTRFNNIEGTGPCK